MFFKSFMAIACTSFVVATSARAQELPSKHVTLMMPYAAGGPGDTLTRIIGQGMGKVLGRVFLVENVAGAGGTLGTAKVRCIRAGWLLAAGNALWPCGQYRTLPQPPL